MTDGSDQPNVLEALISWAHKDPHWDDAMTLARRNDVLRLTQALRRHGIDCDIDALHPNEDWTRWGPGRVASVDFVLVVVSSAWRHAWEGSGDPSRNIGAAAEASALKSIEARGGRNALQSKCRLIQLPGSADDDIPTGMHGLQRYSLNAFSRSDLEPLLRDLTNQPDIVMPALGAVPVLPPSLDLSNFASTNPDEIRDRLFALPEVEPKDAPDVPWVQLRRSLESRLAKLEDETSPGPDWPGVRWTTLPEPMPVVWRGGSQVRTTADGAVVVVHAIPLPERRVSRRLLEDVKEAVITKLRSAAFVCAVDGLSVSHQPDAVVILNPVRPRRWDEVKQAEFSGCRVAGDGQMSIWFSLARDSSGSVLDEGEVSRDIMRGLTVVHAMASAIGGVNMCALGAELDDTTLLTDGTLNDLGNRSSATMRGFSSQTCRIPVEEAVPVDDLVGREGTQVAATLARLLVDAWRR